MGGEGTKAINRQRLWSRISCARMSQHSWNTSLAFTDVIMAIVLQQRWSLLLRGLILWDYGPGCCAPSQGAAVSGHVLPVRVWQPDMHAMGVPPLQENFLWCSISKWRSSHLKCQNCDYLWLQQIWGALWAWQGVRVSVCSQLVPL